MNKRFVYTLLTCLFIIISNFTLAEAKCPKCTGRHSTKAHGIAYYPTQLDKVIQTIYTLPEAREIINQINKEGPIGIVLDSSGDYQAYWDSRHRVITVNPKKNRSTGEYITSILFEMHNALSDKRLTQLTRLAASGQMTKEKYVEAVEKTEHLNAIKTSSLVNKGIRNHLFPADAEWIVFKDFNDHYAVQQLTGHSQYIAKSYDHINWKNKKEPYRGTLHKLRSLSHEEKVLYSKYLSIKNDLESTNRDQITRASKHLQIECEKLEKCYTKNSGKGCKNWDRQLMLLEKTFKGNPVYEMLMQKSPMLTNRNRTPNTIG